MRQANNHWRKSLTLLEIGISTAILASIISVSIGVFQVLSLNTAHYGTETAIDNTMNVVSARVRDELRHALAPTVGFDLSTNDTPTSFREVQFRKVVGLTTDGRPIISGLISYKVDQSGNFVRTENGQSIIIGSFGTTGTTNSTAGLVFLPITPEHDIIEVSVRVRGVNRKTGKTQIHEKTARLSLFNNIEVSSDD